MTKNQPKFEDIDSSKPSKKSDARREGRVQFKTKERNHHAYGALKIKQKKDEYVFHHPMSNVKSVSLSSNEINSKYSYR